MLGSNRSKCKIGWRFPIHFWLRFIEVAIWLDLMDILVGKANKWFQFHPTKYEEEGVQTQKQDHKELSSVKRTRKSSAPDGMASAEIPIIDGNTRRDKSRCDNKSL